MFGAHRSEEFQDVGDLFDQGLCVLPRNEFVDLFGRLLT